MVSSHDCGLSTNAFYTNLISWCYSCDNFGSYNAQLAPLYFSLVQSQFSSGHTRTNTQHPGQGLQIYFVSCDKHSIKRLPCLGTTANPLDCSTQKLAVLKLYHARIIPGAEKGLLFQPPYKIRPIYHMLLESDHSTELTSTNYGIYCLGRLRESSQQRQHCIICHHANNCGHSRYVHFSSLPQPAEDCPWQDGYKASRMRICA